MNDEASPSPVSSPAPTAGLFENWAQVATIVPGLTVVLSIFYNWAYFHVGAPSAIQLLTISDHISSALQWLPASIVTYVAGGVFDSILSPVSTPRQLPNASELNKMSRRKLLALLIINKAYMITVDYIGVGLFCLLIIFYLSSGESNYVPVGAMIIIIWIVLGMRAARKKGWGDNAIYLLIFAPMILGFSLIEGNRRGLADFTTRTGNATVITKEGQRIEPSVILREIDKGMLLRTINENKITLVRWDDVAQLIVSGTPVDSRLRVCKFFKLYCSSSDLSGVPSGQRL